ncbi:MAG: hypothetical protein O7E57_13080 [Gammaproteobacteria bacterium]|nr:hypothetical protein [Gammaproteobacteria bacterium]
MKFSRVIRLVFASIYLTVALQPAQAEQFAIVVLPDTQSYLNANSAIFFAQIQWISDNANSLDADTDGDIEEIIYVTHLGDIVDTISCNPTDVNPPVPCHGARSSSPLRTAAEG